MTKPELIEALRDKRVWTFVFESSAILEMFPEWPLDHHLRRFCDAHGLSYRIVRGKYLFTRELPQNLVEELVVRVQRGECLRLEEPVAN